MRRTRSPAAVIAAAAAVALLAVCLAALGWRVSGGRWYVVRTPSMGRAAPVGTLLLTRPVSLGAVHVGDIITFHAPGTGGEVYSHRVVAKTTAGLMTRGDINPVADPWIVTKSDLIGRVAHRWWGVGWILRMLPLFLLCLALLWGLTSMCAARWRQPLRVFGVGVCVAIVGQVFHPWVGLIKLGTTTRSGTVVLHAVSVGVLPVRIAAHGGGHARLINGQVGAIGVPRASHPGAYGVTAAPGLTFWWWVVVGAVCLAPLLWCLAFGLPATPPHPDDDTTDDLSADDEPDAGLAVMA